MRKYVFISLSLVIFFVCLYCAVNRDSRNTQDSRYFMLKVPPPVALAPPPTMNQPEMEMTETKDEVFFDLPENSESYKHLVENVFRGVNKAPLSTFSIDVDRASYSNMRRFIEMGEQPPAEAIRIEELINYFTYDYPQPPAEDPFSINMELASSPWNKGHQIVQIGLQGKILPTENLPPSNLVFLIDVSGSMNSPNKLPLVKESFNLLIDQLREEDHVGIVVYAGAAGTVLEPISGSKKTTIGQAIANLEAGGSTAGGEGLRLAYALAAQHFKVGGNNRVIIATDGDFNVGESSDEAMEKLIEQKRKEGVYLTVLGYGMGNYKDSKLEILADKGNGNYAYIDDISEARKVLVNEFGGTLFTIAKDVKIQVEFNPAKVVAYRLIGYENRVMQDQDFNNDKKDAGELGSGHTVTALYEIIPADVKSTFYDIDTLKYQSNVKPLSKHSDEIMTVKLRYKKPSEDASNLTVRTLAGPPAVFAEASGNFQWACAVAGFGMLLRNSPNIRGFSFDQVIQVAENAKGDDREGYRTEFIDLVKEYGSLSSR